MEKVWEIKDPDAYLSRRKTVLRKRPPVVEKDPVKAYNSSLLFWGGGQLYVDQPAKGGAFLMLMVFLFAVAVIALANYDQLIPVLREHGISLSDAFLVLETVLFLIILFWTFNAGDAYHHARRTRKAPFRGVDSKLAPVFGSLLIPGWGQYLNGQQFKGSIYNGLGVIGFFSVLSVVLTFFAWPLLDASDSRFLIECICTVSLILVPFVPLLHLVSAFDAFRVSCDDLKKESLWERIKAAYYRCRNQGLRRGVFPGIQGAFLLVLVLTFFVIVVFHWFPKEFYTAQLTAVKQTLSARGMLIVPELIGRLLIWLGGVAS